MAAQGIGLAVGVRGGVVVLAVKQTSNTPDFIIKSLLINAIILQAHYMLRISVINQYRFIFSLIVQLFFQIFDLTFDEWFLVGVVVLQLFQLILFFKEWFVYFFV